MDNEISYTSIPSINFLTGKPIYDYTKLKNPFLPYRLYEKK